MRAYPLSNLKAGIARGRIKGGANQYALYDLLNGYVNEAGVPVNRDGTLIDAVLPAGTVGMMSLLDKKVVFAITTIDLTGTGYDLIVLKHPTDGSIALKKIHYAQTFMRAPYIIAEFVEGTVQHYWLQAGETWVSSAVVLAGRQVVPSIENGYVYTAVRTFATQPAWTPLTAKTVGAIVEPSTPNGYYAEVISVSGATPTTGATEPEWPAEEDAIVVEYSSGTPLTPTNPQVETDDFSDGFGGLNDYNNDRYYNRVLVR